MPFLIDDFFVAFFHLFVGRPLDIRCEPSIFFSFDIESLQSIE